MASHCTHRPAPAIPKMASDRSKSKLAAALKALELHADVDTWLEYTRTEYDDICSFDDVLVHHVLDVIEHVGDGGADGSARDYGILQHMNLPSRGVRAVLRALQDTLHSFTPI